MFTDDEPMATIYLNQPMAEADEVDAYWLLYRSLDGAEVGMGHGFVNVYSDDEYVIGAAAGLLASLGHTVTEIA